MFLIDNFKIKNNDDIIFNKNIYKSLNILKNYKFKNINEYYEYKK